MHKYTSIRHCTTI